MKKIFLLGLFASKIAMSQDAAFKVDLNNREMKHIIDNNAILTWTCIGNQVKISNNGKYVLYDIWNKPVTKSTLVIQDTSSNWKTEFIAAHSGTFSKANDQCVFVMNDTLKFLKLGETKSYKAASISGTYRKAGTNNDWIVWKSKEHPGQLLIYSLITGKELDIKGVGQFFVSEEGNIIVFEEKNNGEIRLKLLDLDTQDVLSIWSAGTTSSTIPWFQFDGSGEQLVFVVKPDRSKTSNSIWYYKKGMSAAIRKLNSETIQKSAGLTIGDIANFSKDGEYIHFDLQKFVPVYKSSSKPQIIIRNYQDGMVELGNQQSASTSVSYKTSMAINGSDFIQLETDELSINAISDFGGFVVLGEDRTLRQHFLGDVKSVDFWLVSIKDGTRKLLPPKNYNTKFYFSPTGKYLVYYDIVDGKGTYYSYDISHGKVRNISAEANTDFHFKNPYYIGLVKRRSSSPAGIAGWIENDGGILVYDNYDVWRLFLTDNKNPINITNGYGKKYGIKFNLQQQWMPLINIKEKSHLLLTAFDVRTKYNGFFKKELKKSGDPVMVSMGPWASTITGQNLDMGGPLFDAWTLDMMPLKATNAEIWIVRKQTAEEAPNYFVTSDLKRFKQISAVNPEKSYKWVTPELVTWGQANGITTQGVLYKPDDFDSTKKYPLLISYYRQLSQRLYQFPRTFLIEDANLNCNIPWFTSRDYLVFTPDIYFTSSSPDQDAFNAIYSAAHFLSQRTYIDSAKIGIAGHSFAGGLTNSIITKTGYFAAAYEGAGTSDLASSYLQIGPDGGSRMLPTEDNRRSTLWEQPKEWLASSPVWNADKITTPLLIFHCKEDEAMPWDQGLFMFQSLWRLNKPAWMLEYEREGHGLNNIENQKDLTVRVLQYFNHYLKNAPAPVWMTRSITARLKEIENDYELDPAGKCGNDCKICDKWNWNYERDSNRVMKEVEEKRKTEFW
ncbi:MAG TPA: prolyl oligopeptidase family serine peptidase [Chitinophagaceae bacterium]|nr:prolyl oligopeptidase family serine peptidase [Chitinophagaceae bacterium]